MIASEPVDRRGWIDLVHFSVGGDVYAIPLDVVTEVVGIGSAAETMIWRGERLPVRAANDVLGLNGDSAVQPRRGIVIHLAEGRFVFAVERVLEVGCVAEDEIEPPPSLLAGRSAELIRGLAAREDRMIVVLEPEALWHRGGNDAPRERGHDGG